MNKALSASDLPLVMWLCGRLDPSAAPSTLPQHILLCLVQQLGASDLLEDTVRACHEIKLFCCFTLDVVSVCESLVFSSAALRAERT